MKRPEVFFALVLGATALQGCERTGTLRADIDSAQLASRAGRLEALKRGADSSSQREPIARWVLPNSLNEVSGLVLTPDGRLFTHGDEKGIVTEIDYRRGVILKQFQVGSNLNEDFEGIAFAHGDFYLLASNGKLYQFKEGADRGQVSYTLHDTELGRECEFEGVAFDSLRNEMELSCKNVGIKDLRHQLVIYRWSLNQASTARLTRLTVPLDRIIGGHDWKEFKPSDITVDPTSGNYVLVASLQNALVVLTPEGHVVAVQGLPAGHDQAEGVAITPDSILIIGDEAVQRPAAITLYRWP